MSKPVKDIIGQIFHNMVAIKYAGKKKWIVQCIRCKATRSVLGQHLRTAERRGAELCTPCGNKMRAAAWKENPPEFPAYKPR